MASVESGHASDVAAIWNEAVDEYERITGVKVQVLARTSSIDSILGEIRVKEGAFEAHRHDRSKVDKFRTLVSRSLFSIQSVAEVITHATKASLPPIEAIFAAVRYLISVANSVSADYDKIAGLFEEFDLYLSRANILGGDIPIVPELKLALVKVFRSVLVLCGICTKYTRTKRIVKAFHIALSGEDAELKAAYDHFHRMVDHERDVVSKVTHTSVRQIKDETHAVHTGVRESLAIVERLDKNIMSVLDGTASMQTRAESRETALERESLLSWLSPHNFLDKQRDTFAKHHRGTCKWLLESSSFQGWCTSAQNSTLWCCGNPGVGKTILLSMAVSYVEEQFSNMRVVVVCIYCDYKTTQTNVGFEVLSSITRQLAENCWPMSAEVEAFRDRYSQRRTGPGEDEHLSLIKTLSRLFERTFIFIDALDEYHEGARDDLLPRLQELEPFARFFITSRPNIDLDMTFTNLCRVNIVAHTSDIRAYVESKIRRFAARDPNLKKDIVEKVCEKADGMFLLAHLQTILLCGQLKFKSIRPIDSKSIRQSLNTLPEDLFLFYETSIQRIENQPDDDRHLAKRALSYIFCAKRRLSVEELLHALSVAPEDDALDESAICDAETLLAVSAGLIAVDEQSNSTRLAHYTLHEYLEKNLEKLLPDPEVEIARTCLTYMAFDEFSRGPCGDVECLEERLGRHPFLDYAARCWGLHLPGKQPCDLINQILSLLHDDNKLAASVQILHLPQHRMRGWHDRFPRSFASIHVVAFWGLDDILNMLCDGSLDVNAPDSYGVTALHLAAQRGHLEVVRSLLRRGADIERRNHKGETALIRAARNGHRAVLESLLSSRADAQVKDNEGWTAFHWAVIGGHDEVAEVLFSQNTDPDIAQRNKALLLAAEAGNDSAVRKLLDLGAEIDWMDDEGSTALTWAVPEGHERVVRTLLEKGADANSKDNYDNTPLHWAIPHGTITRLLIEYKGIVNVHNQDGRTPLHWSALEGQCEVMSILIEAGADVNAKDEYGCTALHAVALKGHEAMAQLLLKNGASPNERDRDGWTPLHAAITREHSNVVRLLMHRVDNGQRIFDTISTRLDDENERALLQEVAEGKSGGSDVVCGLRAAANGGHIEKILALLETGADIDEEDKVGGSTALTIATWLGQNDIMQVLLDNGADVNKRERSGRAALHIAAEGGYHGLVELLVDCGADVNAEIHGWTATLLTLVAGDRKPWKFSTAEYLIGNGADVRARDYHGRGALHWAAKYGKERLARLLIQKGAELDVRDRWNMTPLMWAAKSGRRAMVRLLLQEGADATISAIDGSSALHMAAHDGDNVTALCLIEGGANVNAETRHGLTALHIAAFMGYGSTASLLLEKGADAGLELRCSRIQEVARESEPSVEGDGTRSIAVANSLSMEICQQILEDVNIASPAQDSTRLTAAALAASGGSMALHRLLLQKQKTEDEVVCFTQGSTTEYPEGCSEA